MCFCGLAVKLADYQCLVTVSATPETSEGLGICYGYSIETIVFILFGITYDLFWIECGKVWSGHSRTVPAVPLPKALDSDWLLARSYLRLNGKRSDNPLWLGYRLEMDSLLLSTYYTCMKFSLRIFCVSAFCLCYVCHSPLSARVHDFCAERKNSYHSHIFRTTQCEFKRHLGKYS